jgi:Protein of unknown function (DUF3300)
MPGTHQGFHKNEEGKAVMNPKLRTLISGVRRLLALVCVIVLVPGDTLANVTPMQAQQATAPQEQAAKIPPDQLDSLVAPIALYPDPMLAQVLAASTYPLELIQLQQWLAKNPGLKDKALADAVAKQPWDPSVQAMAGLPDVVKRLADDIQWTTDLGNAFLAQEADVMAAVQRMRQKAQGTGNLKSNEQQKVETKVVESQSVIVIEQANPQVVYVPSYNPTVVYGAPVYPYPPIYYPPPGYYAAGMAISFGIGIAMGAMWGGGWGWGCGWGGNNVNVNINNNFNRNTNINGGNRNNINGGNRPGQLPAGGRGNNNWQHNPQHRGGAPYGDRSVANRYGGTARGDSLANRQAGARNQVGRQGGNLASNNRGGVGGAGGAGGPGSAGGAGNRGGAGVSNRAGGGANSIGGRNLSNTSAGNRGTFGGGGGGGYNGSQARASSNRGASSMGSRGGGGGRSGGGGGRRR